MRFTSASRPRLENVRCLRSLILLLEKSSAKYVESPIWAISTYLGFHSHRLEITDSFDSLEETDLISDVADNCLDREYAHNMNMIIFERFLDK